MGHVTRTHYHFRPKAKRALPLHQATADILYKQDNTVVMWPCTSSPQPAQGTSPRHSALVGKCKVSKQSLEVKSFTSHCHNNARHHSQATVKPQSGHSSIADTGQAAARPESGRSQAAVRPQQHRGHESGSRQATVRSQSSHIEATAAPLTQVKQQSGHSQATVKPQSGHSNTADTSQAALRP